jgi:hypothetical protein
MVYRAMISYHDDTRKLASSKDRPRARRASQGSFRVSHRPGEARVGAQDRMARHAGSAPRKLRCRVTASSAERQTWRIIVPWANLAVGTRRRRGGDRVPGDLPRLRYQGVAYAAA